MLLLKISLNSKQLAERGQKVFHGEKRTKKGNPRGPKLWHELQADTAKKSAVPALVATVEDLPELPKWDDILEDLRRADQRRRLTMANDLLWTIRFFKGKAWLQGDQLCVQPIDKAKHFAPVIKALKTEIVTILLREV